jgi:hypothetical protein
MANMTTPTINRIIRMTSFDLLRTKVTMGNMYMCLDTSQLYYDASPTSRVTYQYTGVKTINELTYNIMPVLNNVYYCWEDNSLWIWLNKWVALYTDTTYPSAYIYDDAKNLNAVYRYDMQNFPADDNGLLKDGSVVVRDRNRIIKGKIYIDDGNDNIVWSSFLGGGMRFLPNGKASTDGELLLSDRLEEDANGQEVAIPVGSFRGEFKTINNDFYVDYSEKPELDKSINKNDTHIYKVYHEGNLDTVKAGFKKYTQVVGGNSKTIPITHNLSTKNVLVLVHDDNTGKALKFSYVIHNTNSLTITLDDKETAFTKNIAIIGF